MFIIDIGSGNSLTSVEQACKTILKVKEMAIPNSYVKFQLFQKAGNNIPLNPEIFDRAVRYCHIVGMPYGVSVFDEWSLDLAIHSGALKFLKMANNKELHYLINKAPDEDRWIISTDDLNLKIDRHDTDIIYCISKYPAKEKDYEDKFGDKLKQGISDHTTSWTLFKKYLPKIYECHFRLSETTGLDSGKFARLPEQFEDLKAKHDINDLVKEYMEEDANSSINSSKIGK